MMACVAEGALQVASGEAHESGRLPGVIPFALKGIEYLVDQIVLHISTCLM